MTDTIDPFPQHRADRTPRPSIAEILIEGATTDQPERDMLMRIAEHHPKATRTEFEAAVAAAQGVLAGRQEAAKPTVDAYWVVHRIARQTFDAVYARDGEDLTSYSLIKEAGPLIGQHPGHDLLLLWLAQKGLDSIFDELGSERGIWPNYYPLLSSPAVEATQEDLDYEPPPED
jgi:hypothetical protein